MASISFISASRLINLLQSIENLDRMYVKVINATRLALGIDPLEPTTIIDLANEQILPYTSTDSTSLNQNAIAPPEFGSANWNITSKAIRSTGKYWFELRSRRVKCRSLRELLMEGLKVIEECQPGTFEKLSRIKPRTRRIISRDRMQLFDKQNLVRYSDKLDDEWWVGTNNSSNETNVWLERACTCAGLKWGEEFFTSLTPQLDDL